MGKRLGRGKHLRQVPKRRHPVRPRRGDFSTHPDPGDSHTLVYAQAQAARLGPSLPRRCSPVAIFRPPKSEPLGPHWAHLSHAARAVSRSGCWSRQGLSHLLLLSRGRGQVPRALLCHELPLWFLDPGEVQGAPERRPERHANRGIWWGGVVGWIVCPLRPPPPPPTTTTNSTPRTASER